MNYRRIPSRPTPLEHVRLSSGHCIYWWCDCLTWVPPPPLKEETPLVRLLRLEGRHAAADAYQAQWEAAGNYELPGEVVEQLIEAERA